MISIYQLDIWADRYYELQIYSVYSFEPHNFFGNWLYRLLIVVPGYIVDFTMHCLTWTERHNLFKEWRIKYIHVYAENAIAVMLSETQHF